MQWKQAPTDRRSHAAHGGAHDDVDLEQRGDQRRRFARLPLRLWTEGRRAGQVDFHNCSNLSEDGIFIETNDPYALGTEVAIEFNLPGVHEPIAVLGRVASVLDEATAEGAIMGNGFRFVRIAESDRLLLRSYLAFRR